MKAFFIARRLAWMAVFLLLVMQAYPQVPVVSGGTGAPEGTYIAFANNAGGSASGLGCGGGGGSWWGGSGGAGKFGGGGGGAAGYFDVTVNWAGGDGGQGVVVVAYFNASTLTQALVLNTGTSVTVPAGVTSAKVWAIGGGGGGGGATQNDGTSGGSGGAGGVAYITRSVTQGDIISYTLGAGGKPGHGAIAGTAGGNTSATIGGTTIYGNGGAAGLYNNTTNVAGGTFSGGDGGANGGTGYGRSGDVGGGGGGGIGGANGTQNGRSGGTGANSIDVSGLFEACAIASVPTVPVLSDFNPKSGLAGTIISITGQGFTGATAVTIGGIAASSFTVNSDVSISATVATGTVTGSVSVTTPSGTISKPIYMFQAPALPSISSFTPTSAQRGRVVTINGSNFLGASSVTFGGTPALNVNIISNSIIEATVGDGSTGDVVVSVSANNATLAGFTWLSTTQASNIGFPTIEQTSLVLDWTVGNADKRIVFVKQGTGAITNPSNFTTFTASTDWNAKGTQIGSSGYYCVYNGTGNTVTLTNLAANTQYTVYVFEYNGTAGKEVYYTSTATGNPATQSTASLLPLKWVSISAKLLSKMQVGLQWQTEAEVNCKHFVIEKSSNGVQFTSIATVAAQNQMSNHYHFTDASAPAQTIWYRIRQINTDGKYTISNTVLLQLQAATLKVINPVLQKTLQLQLPVATSIQLLDANGRQWLLQKLPAGNHRIPVQQCNTGLYWIVTSDNRIAVWID